jgi:hypothetical protein
MTWKENGMTTSTPTKTVRIERVRVSEAALIVDFDDGRSISLPLAWYPRLEQGAATECNTYRLIGGGEGVNWPLLDEDLSAEGLLAGRPSVESQRSLQRWLKAHKAKSVG